MKYSLPDGYLYCRYPKDSYPSKVIISLLPFQAVLLRLDTGKEMLFSVRGDYELGYLTQERTGKISCEIEFLSLLNHLVGWGKSFVLWDGSYVGMNGSMTLCPDIVRVDTETPNPFIARCRSLCDKSLKLKPDNGYAVFTREVVNELVYTTQVFAKQNSYNSTKLIEREIDVLTEISSRLPLTFASGVVLTAPFMINSMIFPEY